MQPLISLITPTLNAERYIVDTLRSVNAQDYPRLEHIIVDGNSSDATLALVKKTGKRVSKVLKNKDSGTSEAINTGFSLAKGDFLWVLNSDDLLENNTTISTLYTFLIHNPQCDFVFGNMRMIDNAGRTIGHRFFQPEYGILDILADRRHLPFAGCLLRRSLLERLNGFNTQYYYANDLEFYIRLAHFGKMQCINTTTGVFRLHSQASTSKNIMETGRETFELCERYLNRNDLPEIVQRHKRSIQASVQLHAARVHFHAGSPQDVRHHIFNVFKISPKLFLRFNTLLYLMTSFLGAWGMTRLSSLSRYLLHKKLFYIISYKLHGMPW